MRSRPRTVMRSGAPGPAPMKCTVMGASSESATAQVAPSAASRGPSSRPPAPAPASAAASAMAGTPKRAWTAAERRQHPRRLRLERRERQRRQRRAEEPRGFDEPRLVRLGREGEQPQLALRRAEIRRAPGGRARRSVARHARAASEADGDDAAHGFVHRHCTIGIAARQPVKRPTGSACAIAIWPRSPPRFARPRQQRPASPASPR